jgi:hypothetical protein
VLSLFNKYTGEYGGGIMWVLIIIGALFFLIGLTVHKFKWYFLISGYNTMSKDKKENVDVEGLARLLGIYSYVGGGGFILAGIMYGIGLEFFVQAAIILFVIMTFYMLIKAQKYDGNVYDKEGKLRKRAWKQAAIPGAIVIVSLIFVIVLFFFSLQATKVTFLEEGIKIHGMYGNVYEWETIETTLLKDELPTIEMRTNGSALGSKLKGYFRTKELGTVKLFVDKKKSPFIYLETSEGKAIFNMDSEDETKDIFEEILSRIE